MYLKRYRNKDIVSTTLQVRLNCQSHNVAVCTQVYVGDAQDGPYM